MMRGGHQRAAVSTDESSCSGSAWPAPRGSRISRDLWRRAQASRIAVENAVPHRFWKVIWHGQPGGPRGNSSRVPKRFHRWPRQLCQHNPRRSRASRHRRAGCITAEWRARRKSTRACSVLSSSPIRPAWGEALAKAGSTNAKEFKTVSLPVLLILNSRPITGLVALRFEPTANRGGLVSLR